MRIEFLQSIDFNQMLVYSTFTHLLFFIVMISLPNPSTQEQIIVPTFRLSLIELPAATKPAPKPVMKQKVATPPVKKRVVSEKKPIAKKQKIRKIKKLALKPKLKQLPPPKPLEKKTVVKELLPPQPILKESEAKKKILEDLKTFGNSASKKTILQELDEVARAVPETPAKKAVTPKPMQEETFKEIEGERAPELPLKSEQATLSPLVKDSEVEAKERILAELLKKTDQIDPLTPQIQVKKAVSPKLTKPKQATASDLIKELEAIEMKSIFQVDAPKEKLQPEKLNSVFSPKDFGMESLTSVAEKLKALEESAEEVKMDISQDRMVHREFKTVIQRNETPVLEIDSDYETSNALSLYMGEVYKRVDSKLKTPIGSKAKKAVVIFTIFRHGNIDKPVIQESTEDENLDSIAVRAVYDAAPFPPLPEELSRPNLRVSIIFKYVPEKK